MKFSDIENIWSADAKLLSNSDRGRVYYERAKQVIGAALANPKERHIAVDCQHFSRSYLVEKVGCTASVATQNPKIRQLLVDTDRQIAEQSSSPDQTGDSGTNEQEAELGRLRQRVAALQLRVQDQAHLIAKLRCQLRVT